MSESIPHHHRLFHGCRSLEEQANSVAPLIGRGKFSQSSSTTHSDADSALSVSFDRDECESEIPRCSITSSGLFSSTWPPLRELSMSKLIVTLEKPLSTVFSTSVPHYHIGLQVLAWDYCPVMCVCYVRRQCMYNCQLVIKEFTKTTLNIFTLLWYLIMISWLHHVYLGPCQQLRLQDAGEALVYGITQHRIN